MGGTYTDRKQLHVRHILFCSSELRLAISAGDVVGTPEPPAPPPAPETDNDDDLGIERQRREADER